MKKVKTPVSVFIASGLLGAYCLAVAFNAPLELTAGLFSIFPFFVIWMVLSVLRSKTGHYKELAEGEEWGYADKNKDDLGAS